MVNRQISLDQGIHLVTRSLEALVVWEGVCGGGGEGGKSGVGGLGGLIFFDKWVIARVTRVPG